MARNMSFMLTTQQILAGTKDVTRRLGWWTLKPGDQLNAVEKGMGLKRGQKVVRLRRIEVTSVRHERLDAITPEDVVREGFPEMTTSQFVEMFCRTHQGCTPATIVNRIEFKYLEAA
jgi:hypothetical protein